ncbi:MAG TPA: hypothetical protein VHG28_01230, partial [Longimicrobiaceae bacterium]|nr:hypothetical protein [Longimicrobiaceae bacterium]
MRRTLFIAIFLGLAAAPGLAAQTGEIGVSLTIVEPISLAARADATVRHRAGEYVEISMPLELGGNGSQIVAVAGSAPVEMGTEAGSALMVRNGSGSFEALTG